ncbi:ABC iron(III) transporter periplasmic binding protein [Psychromonas ingrahamii 37]|uniref:ABC iron(III) transporter periplasmic binding protein n=1 Tax=Psychromonas ingrahamii (strain DSM 17664 / CCUG 51855 / 37) TaxID=357804 RepID=A1SYZ4_PSYIN|nr:Fe(3+) ABC transporter substrate-binding protein [Psychromonas ingrahamii]ABM04709.1 ABC iron(III) transporter periplasmic binding protein [Psychromonas ingrahamii 37]
MFIKKLLTSAAIFSTLSVSSFTAYAEEVNIYSFRQPFLIEPIMEKFTKQTGIKVNILFAKSGLIERVKREGKLSPADLVLTSDFSRLMMINDERLTQSVDSKILTENIPSQYRDPQQHWFALTTRVRNIYSSAERVGPTPNITYQDLASPEFKGKVCMRAGKHPYNVSLLASVIAHEGKANAKTWLEGLKANLARKPQGNDRAQVKAIKDGLCDYALGNSYYLGKMLADPQQLSWAEAVNINFPNQTTTGSHINVSGVVLTKYAPNKASAIKLMEFLSGETAQQIYAEANYEYPVNANVAPSELVGSWGEFKADSISLSDIAKQHRTAVKLLDEVKFDL